MPRGQPMSSRDRAAAPQSKRVMSFQEWCAFNSISPDTGRRIIAAGKIKVMKLSDRRIGIREDHNAEYQAACVRGGE
jgi:predicted site-specific integrase-resolvase